MPSPTTRFSRPGIRDLGVLTLGSALGLAAYRSITPGRPLPSTWQIMIQAYNLGMSFAFGLILMGAVGLLVRYCSARRTPFLPGHWLLMFGCASAVIDVLAMVVFSALDSIWSWPVSYFHPYWVLLEMGNYPHLPALAHQIVGWGLGLVLAGGFLRANRRTLPWPWLVVFGGFGVVAALFAGAAVWGIIYLGFHSDYHRVFHWYRVWAIPLHAWSIFILATTVLVAVALDYRQNRLTTDWPHWAGVSAWLVVAGTQLACFGASLA